VAYAVVKIEKTGDAGVAFTAGIHDTGTNKSACDISIDAHAIEGDGYLVYKLGTFTPNAKQYFWAAPASNGANIKAVWVDRFVIVPAEAELRK
jgi:hypothetical protein